MAAKNTKDISKLRVAIVHDWLIGGGAEKVVMQLHRMFPDAPIYTSYCTDEWRQKLDGRVITGYLQHWPFSRLRKLVGILRVWWFGHLDFTGYEVVISSTGNGEAFGIKPPKGVTHICYCHTPTHYYWRHYNLYLKRPGMGILNPLARLGLRLLVGPLRRWDYRAAQRVDYFIANSTHIKNDIKRYYGRDATVIFPPQDVTGFEQIKDTTRQGFIITGRQVPHKHAELAVQACNELGRKLVVVGKGPENDRLRALAGPTIEFKGWVSDVELHRLLAGAEAFIFPAFDDFGLAPIAAMAVGTPVIAYKAGGALDYVVPHKTGLFFAEQTVDSLKQTLQTFQTESFDHAAIRRAAQTYSAEQFQTAMRTFIANAMSVS